MGKAVVKAKDDESGGEMQALLPETPAQQGVEAITGADLLTPDLAAVPDVAVYELPTWSEFRGFVMDNGNKYVRASYPNAPTDLIETIWCGVPVIEHEQARVMSPAGDWLVY